MTILKNIMQQDEKDKKLVATVFPKATLKRIIREHKVREETRISEKSIEELNAVLDELVGWIVRESEKLANNEGKLTITPKHIREATKIYFG